MKIHITDAYTLNNTAKRKTTQYRYETTDAVEKNEIPLINYYDGNWVTKSTTDNSIQGYDNEGFRTSNDFGSTYYSVRSNSTYDRFYINDVPSNTDYNSTYDDLVFTYYGNYKVNFIPIPAHYFRYEVDPETQMYTGNIEQIDTTFYISIARVTKDNTYSKSHSAEFSKLSGDQYLKGVVVDETVSSDDTKFTYWKCGGSYYGYRDRTFTDYIDLGNIISDLDGIYVPKNTDSYILTYKYGVSESFKVSQIKSAVLPNNILKYYASGPIHYFYNGSNKFHYIMDFRFLPYSATIDDCYKYKYSQNTSELILDNLTSYDSDSKRAIINFNNNSYTVNSGTMFYIGIDEFISWYKNKLEGATDSYILNRHYYTSSPMESIDNKIYPDCNINYCQAVINEIKRLYNDSCFDIHLYDNGFHDAVFDSRYQAGKYKTRNITEKITVKEDNYFKTI